MSGLVVGFTGGKNAPGTTFCVANVGLALARAGRSVLAVDLDPSGGLLAAYLGLSLRRGLYPLSRTKGPRPTPYQLRAEAEVRHGLAAVAGIPRAADADGIDFAAVAQSSRDLAAFVLVDAGRLPGPGLPILEACERVLVVVRPDPVGILAAEQALVALAEIEATPRTALVVSGLVRRRAGELPDVRSLLGRPVVGVVPLAEREARRAREKQHPVGGAAGRAFERVGTALAEGRGPGVVWRLEEEHPPRGGTVSDAASS